MTHSRIPHLMLALLLLGLAAPVSAQSGTVTYEHTLRFDVNLPPEFEQFAQYMPESATTTFGMDFTEAASMTRAMTNEVELPEGGTSFSDDGANIKISFRGSGGDSDDTASATYVDLDLGTYVEQRTFLGRTFLITGALPELSWKLSGEEGQMLDRHVLKATAMMDTVAVEAWFTPEIPVSLGPAEYGGLPGLILMLSLGEGQQLYEASEIQLDTMPNIAPPDEGREVTREEFETLVAERMEDRMKNMEGAMRIMVRQ